MKKTTVLILSLVLVLVLVIAGALYSNLSGQVDTHQLSTQSTTVPGDGASETTQPDMSAPDFTVVDPEGNPHRLSDFEGKPVILNFWASWCGPCKSEMPDFQEAYLEYGERLHFLMVNCTDGSRETVEIASGFIKEQGYTFPVYYDTTMEAAITYGASAIPMTFFIDAGGNLVAYATGALSADVLQRGIDMLLPAK